MVLLREKKKEVIIASISWFLECDMVIHTLYYCKHVECHYKKNIQYGTKRPIDKRHIQFNGIQSDSTSRRIQFGLKVR